MKFISILFLTFLLLGCGQDNSNKADFSYQERDVKSFSTIINPTNTRSEERTKKKIMVFNSDYPFYFWIYDDNTFDYDLPGIGKDHGRWSYRGKQLNLKAELDIFDLDVLISITDKDEYVFKFDDRHGPQIYSLEISYD